MKSINRSTLLGNVGKDPDVRTTPGGRIVANVSLATSDRYKDDKGNWQERTAWHNLVALGRTAEVIRDYVRKGNKLYVDGRINYRSYEDNGTKVYRTEIIVENMSMLSGRDESNKPSSSHADEIPQNSDVDYDIPF